MKRATRPSRSVRRLIERLAREQGYVSPLSGPFLPKRAAKAALIAMRWVIRAEDEWRYDTVDEAIRELRERAR